MALWARRPTTVSNGHNDSKIAIGWEMPRPVDVCMYCLLWFLMRFDEVPGANEVKRQVEDG